MHIGFDLDGVIIDHTANKQRVAKSFGIDLEPKQTPSGIFQEYIPKDVKADMELAIYENPDMDQAPAMMAGSSDFLERVRISGVPYTLISRRQNHEIARKLLSHRELSPQYFHEENTFFVPDKPSKNTKAIEVGVTHYIDDEPSVLEHLTSVPHKFLFDPHGVWPDSPAYTRVGSWKELSALFFT